MTVQRIMGTETEYAVSCAGVERYNPVRLSFDVVAAASDPRSSHIRWDYRQEDPVNDARGHRLNRAAARPDMLTDEPQLHITNVIAPNGGRIYVDHAHPEYSAPETHDPFAALAYDKAGDRLMQQAAERASTTQPHPIVLHKNNVDGKGASWGSHENYMMLRSVPFDIVAQLMTAHLVTRQIYTGSGRVGIGEHGEIPGFQLSQRADYIRSRIGLQTTFERPIINTRDESHSTDAYRRLHVIVGDANRMDVPQTLKLGTTSMLLWILEVAWEGNAIIDDADSTDNATMNDNFASSDVANDNSMNGNAANGHAAMDGGIPGVDTAVNEEDDDIREIVQTLLDRVRLADPVDAMHIVSHDLGLNAQLDLQDGTQSTAWQIQVTLMTTVFQIAAHVYGTDSRGEPAWPDTPTQRIMDMWKRALKDIAVIRHADDDQRLHMNDEASRVEWLLKWQLLERLRRKIAGASADASPREAVSDSLHNAAEADSSPSSPARLAQWDTSWADSRLSALDLRWAALDPRDSITQRLRSQMEHLDVSAADGTDSAEAQSEITRSDIDTETLAPNDTRAWLRARLLRDYPEQVISVSWSRIRVRDESEATGTFTLDMSDPRRFTSDDCEAVFDAANSVNARAAQILKNIIRGM